MSGLNRQRYHRLPDVYTQATTPVGTASIIRAETLKRRPYLDKIIPEIHADVEVLIGTNASTLLEPWEIAKVMDPWPLKLY